MIGKYTFDKNNITLHQRNKTTDGIIDNRNRVINYCATCTLKIMNIMFQKPDTQLYTYAQPGTIGPPYTRPRYETIDYILSTNAWKNTVKDATTDNLSGINTTHLPVIAKIKIQLNSQFNNKKQTQTHKISYNPCTEEDRYRYNEALNNIDKNNITNDTTQSSWTYDTAKTTINNIAQMHIPQARHNPKQDYISAPTERLMEERRHILATEPNNYNKIITYSKTIKRHLKKR